MHRHLEISHSLLYSGAPPLEYLFLYVVIPSPSIQTPV